MRNSVMPRLLVAAILLSAVSLHADTENQIKRSVPLPAGTRFTFHGGAGGSVAATTASGDAAVIDVHFRSTRTQADLDRYVKQFSLSVEQHGAEVVVTTAGQKGASSWSLWTWLETGLSNVQIEYRIQLPPRADATFETSGGSITVKDLKGSVDARTSGGAISATDLGGNLNARTSGGSITVSDVRGNVDAHTSGGSLRVAHVGGMLNGATSGGSISAEDAGGAASLHTSGGGIVVDGAPGPLEAATSGGSINVGITSAKGFDLDAAASGGKVICDFPLSSVSEHNDHELSGRVAAGGPLIHLRTSGGNIRIGQRGSALSSLAN